MKSKIIAVVSGLCVLGLGIFAVVQMNNTRSFFSIAAIIVSLVPMYFLYSAIILKTYDEEKKDYRVKDRSLNKTAAKKKSVYREGGVKKAANDYGKVIKFPKDRQK